jgi:tetratricopeptide (TPR) repeat protein/serine/threonine protein kinase
LSFRRVILSEQDLEEVEAMNEESLFAAALEKADAAERRAFLDAACDGDIALRERLEQLLGAHGQAAGILERGPDAAAMNLSQTATPLAIDRPFARRFKLRQKLGAGGMGEVWVADQLEPIQRRVALKVVRPGFDSARLLTRFDQERQALALMDHPNIAKVLDAGLDEVGRPYFVMELIKGVPITRYCDDARLSPRERLALFIPVCQAVQHAHQKGIIHRDLKPSNILVTPYDGKPVPKVIDFGVAKAIGPRLTEQSIYTEVGALIGTLEYMSPEQAELNNLDIDTRSDIYSLGVVLYELLTGGVPFSRKELQASAFTDMLRIIREVDPPKPSTKLSSSETLPNVAAVRQMEPEKLIATVRGDLDWIVVKCLEKDRARRYATASGLAGDIERYLCDQPVEACPPSATYRLRKFARRHKGSLAVVAVALLATAVMVASIGWAVRDRAAQQTELKRLESARLGKVEGQIRDSLSAARTLLIENKSAAARDKLAQARAQLGDGSALGNLAAEVEACAADLDRFQQFLDLVDRAQQELTGPLLEPALVAGSSYGRAGTPIPVETAGRRPAAAVPFVLKALERYNVLEDDRWTGTLDDGLLGRQQVQQIRTLVYEELLWLADDMVRRQREHRSERKLSPAAAARAAFTYLGKAESAHRPTRAFYALRARCRNDLGDKALAQADTQLADRTPPTIALDHFLQGQASYDAKQVAEAVNAFEAALRLEPTHYWSLMWLGYCLCDLGQEPENFAGAARVFTGCILKRPDHAQAYYCRANAYSKLRRNEDAVADYSRAIELDPKDARFWYNRGVAYHRLRQMDKALGDFSRAIELHPKEARAWSHRGLAYHALGQPGNAIADYSKAIELDPKDALPWYNRGLVYDDMRQLNKALGDYSKAIELKPTYVAAWYNRGFAHERLHEPDEAVADYSRAIDLDPKHVAARANRSIVYMQLSQLDKAIADASRAVELDPGDARVWHTRGLVYDHMRERNKALADYSRAIELNAKYLVAWYNRGVLYDRMRQPDKALADYSRAIELDANYADAWNNRGLVYMQQGQPDKAVADFSRAIELDPKYVFAWYNRGNTYTTLGQPDKALADYSKAIGLDAKRVDAWNSRGGVYNQLGQPQKALADFSRAIELDAKHASAWYNRGNTYRKLGQPDKALADYSRAIELNAKYVDAWNNRGLVYKQLGRLDKAVADFSRGIELNPKYVFAWYNRGNTYTTLGQPKMAAADFSTALKIDPKDPRLWNNRGVAYDQLGQPDKALADFSRAIELNPRHLSAWYSRGLVYDKLGQPDKAVAEFSRVIELAPNDPELVDAYWLRAQAHVRLAHFEQAQADYQKYLKRVPTHAGAHNDLAWLLATCPEVKLRDAGQAVESAKKAVQLASRNATYWRTLGVAHYRAGDWKAAVLALNKSLDLGQDGDARSRLFLAMAHHKLGKHADARQEYEQAVQWLEKNGVALEKDKQRAEELKRFRTEAEQVLEPETAEGVLRGTGQSYEDARGGREGGHQKPRENQEKPEDGQDGHTAYLPENRPAMFFQRTHGSAGVA